MALSARQTNASRISRSAGVRAAAVGDDVTVPGQLGGRNFPAASVVSGSMRRFGLGFVLLLAIPIAAVLVASCGSRVDERSESTTPPNDGPLDARDGMLSGADGEQRFARGQRWHYLPGSRTGAAWG